MAMAPRVKRSINDPLEAAKVTEGDVEAVEEEVSAEVAASAELAEKFRQQEATTALDRVLATPVAAAPKVWRVQRAITISFGHLMVKLRDGDTLAEDAVPAGLIDAVVAGGGLLALVE